MHSIVCVSQTRTVWSKLAETSLCSDWLLHLTNVTPDRCPANLPLVLNPFSSRSRIKILLSLDETANFSWLTGDHDISDKYFFDIASEYSSCFVRNRNWDFNISLEEKNDSTRKSTYRFIFVVHENFQCTIGKSDRNILCINADWRNRYRIFDGFMIVRFCWVLAEHHQFIAVACI